MSINITRSILKKKNKPLLIRDALRSDRGHRCGGNNDITVVWHVHLVFFFFFFYSRKNLWFSPPEPGNADAPRPSPPPDADGIRSACGVAHPCMLVSDCSPRPCTCAKRRTGRAGVTLRCSSRCWTRTWRRTARRTACGRWRAPAKRLRWSARRTGRPVTRRARACWPPTTWPSGRRPTTHAARRTISTRSPWTWVLNEGGGSEGGDLHGGRTCLYVKSHE